MAPQLCCTAEDEGRPDSPQLPNARISDATTPARRPLIPKRTPSHGSRFTSARSEDLHEMRQIFDNARDHSSCENTPANHNNPHFKRPSVYSLHNLHNVRSMQAFIKRKLSKDLSREQTPPHKDKGKKKAEDYEEPDTVVKLPCDGPNLQMRITKDDLRKNLLSDQKPEEGGYDSDAEVLDDIAKNIGRRSPSKRPSLHSIDWASSPSKHTTPSSAKELNSADPRPNFRQHHAKTSNLDTKTPIAALFSQFTSSPNLRQSFSKEKEPKLRRSHSATTIELAKNSKTSAIYLPKVVSDEDAPWSTSMHESLRLSRFLRTPDLELNKEPSKGEKAAENPRKLATIESGDTITSVRPRPQVHRGPPALQGAVQQTTHTQVGSSIKSGEKHFKNDPSPDDSTESKDSEDMEGQNSARNSVHLSSMRISHHLRSGSLLSWDALAADAPDMPVPPTSYYQRNITNISNLSHLNQISNRARHERQTSSSGFASSKVPTKWGRVLHSEQNLRNDRDGLEDQSSMYSSRPQSPPDSVFASTSRFNLSTSVTNFESAKATVSSLPKSNTVIFEQTDDEETPRPKHRYGVTNAEMAKATSSKDKLVPASLARNNSVADTKKSKFREEFSPSPPKKQIISSASIMQFLRPKKSVRSRSDTSLSLSSKMDGPSEGVAPEARHERRMSKSMVSLQTEQAALGKDKAAIPMWERALKAHQEERASMFLPANKALAVQGSPFRDRNASVARPNSTHSAEELEQSPKQASKRMSLPAMQGALQVTNPFMRRSALIQQSPGSTSPGQPATIDLHKQADSQEAVGAWGRYPSHTRYDRTASAGKGDNVHPRDFALEKAIQFAMGEDEVDPIARVDTPAGPGGKKKKKRTGDGRLMKSNSMTFGKTFLKNYARIFRSQSTEFRRHGHGHRSSITAGGTLLHPDLEMLPDVFHPDIAEELARNSLHNHQSPAQDIHNKGKQRADDTPTTLRPTARQRSDSDPIRPSFDGANDAAASSPDKARVWSVYYETCIPNFPRTSFDPVLDLDFMSTAHKLPSRQVSVRSSSVPVRMGHSRARSGLSRASMASGVPSFEEGIAGGNGAGCDGRSVVSVRRSTLDLVQLCRDQEVVERERVLGLVRGGSRREVGGAVAV